MKLSTAVCSVFLAAGLAAPAFAGLGEDAASVQSDVVRMKGSLRLTTTAGYTVHEITSGSGVVREYVSPAGKVFAVSWRGPGVPDLRQMLGSYYDQFAKAADAARPGDHHQLRVEHPAVVVESSGHLRTFVGRAWAPDLLPQHFSVSEIN